jgi:hypothetical protein
MLSKHCQNIVNNIVDNVTLNVVDTLLKHCCFCNAFLKCHDLLSIIARHCLNIVGHCPIIVMSLSDDCDILCCYCKPLLKLYETLLITV